MGYLALNLWICHLVISKVGLIFIDAEILRAGNEQLLDELEEGVIILQAETKEIVFHNNAANQISCLDQNFEASQSLVVNSHTNNLQMDLQVFAHIDKEMFKQTIIDTAKVAEKINQSEDYKTLLEVV